MIPFPVQSARARRRVLAKESNPMRPAPTSRAHRRAGLALLSLLLLFCAGCASDVRLRDPRTGQLMVCEGGFHAQAIGGLIDGSTDRLRTRCVDDYQAQGFVRMD